MTAPADPAGALASYFATTLVNDLVGGRIYRPELNSDDDEQMPQGAIVIRRAGGYQLFGGANIMLGDPRLDVFCYGGTWLEAERIASAVVIALKQLRGGTYDSTRLYWARIESGPQPYENPETFWPAHVVTAQVAFCEIATA
jgi:hypothetical protein